MAVFALASPESLRDECVQSHEQASTKEPEYDENVGAETYSAHGSRAVREPPNHHGVDDGHAHPTKFGEHKRNSELQGRPEFSAKCLKSKHVRSVRAKSVSGTEQRSNAEGNEARPEDW